MPQDSLKSRWGRFGSRIWPYLVILVFTGVLLDKIISDRAFVGGLDTYFHMNSFYEDAMQIKTHHFNYFLSLFGFARSGRIVNALYGPVFNYLAGFLLLICGSWIRFGISLFMITLFIGGVGFYLAARALRSNQIIAVGLALVYMMTRPLITAWLGNSEFTGLGATFLPYILLVGIRMARDRRIKVIPLAVVMAICLQVHLMTSLMAAGALIPFFMAGMLGSSHRMRMLLRGGLALVIAVLLTGNVWGAIWDVFSTNRLIPTFPNPNLRSAANDTASSVQNGTITTLGTAMTLALILVILLAILRWRSVSGVEWALWFDSLAFLWLSSVYFPWNRFVRVVPRLAFLIQFPQRFIVVPSLAVLLLLSSFGSRWVAIRHWQWQTAAYLMVVVLLGMSLLPTLRYTNWLGQVWYQPYVVRYHDAQYMSRKGPQIRSAYCSPHLGKGVSIVRKSTPDYLPTTSRITARNYYRLPIFNEFNHQMFDNHLKVRKSVDARGDLVMDWRNPQPFKANDPTLILHKYQVPAAVKYRHTKVILNHHEIHPRITQIGTTWLRARPGHNHLVLRYEPGRLFKIAALVTILTWLILIGIVIGRLLKTNHH